MNKHTPGPWVWTKVAQDGQLTEHTLEGPKILCRYWHDPPDADARLIAAAPDLYEAALKVQCYCCISERESGHKVDCWMPELEAAIQKALGAS